MNEVVLLSPETWWTILIAYILSPLWLLSSSDNKKTWLEFRYGVISHKCEFDYSVVKGGDGVLRYHSCKHFGCGVVTVSNETGNIYH